MFGLLESKFRINNLFLLELEILLKIIQFVVEGDECSSLFVELVLRSFIVVLSVSASVLVFTPLTSLPAVYA